LVRKAPWGTLSLVALFLFFHAWVAILAQGEEKRSVFLLLVAGAKVEALVRGGEWFRLVASSLLHGNLSHLVVNSLGVLLFGCFLEYQVGTARTMATFVLSAAVGSLLSCWTTDMPAVGASGGMFGLLGAAVVAALLRGKRDSSRSLRLAYGVALPVAFGVSAFLFGLRTGGADDTAHLGGVACGLALGLAWRLDMLAVAGEHECKRQDAKCKVQNGQASRLSATIDHRPSASAGRFGGTSSAITHDRRSTRSCLGSRVGDGELAGLVRRTLKAAVLLVVVVVAGSVALRLQLRFELPETRLAVFSPAEGRLAYAPAGWRAGTFSEGACVVGGAPADDSPIPCFVDPYYTMFLVADDDALLTTPVFAEFVRRGMGTAPDMYPEDEIMWGSDDDRRLEFALLTFDGLGDKYVPLFAALRAAPPQRRMGR
jgi:membrane associated rhomboid family serine protease